MKALKKSIKKKAEKEDNGTKNRPEKQGKKSKVVDSTPSILITTLNVKGLNIPIKKLSKQIFKKHNLNICCL